MATTTQHPIKANYLCSLLHQCGVLKNGLGYNEILKLLIDKVGNHPKFKTPLFWEEFYSYSKRFGYALKQITIHYEIARTKEAIEKHSTPSDLDPKTIIAGKRSFVTPEEAEAFSERLAFIKLRLSFRGAGQRLTKLSDAYGRVIDCNSSQNYGGRDSKRAARDAARKNHYTLKVQFQHHLLLTA